MSPTSRRFRPLIASVAALAVLGTPVAAVASEQPETPGAVTTDQPTAPAES